MCKYENHDVKADHGNALAGNIRQQLEKQPTGTSYYFFYLKMSTDFQQMTTNWMDNDKKTYSQMFQYR